MSRRAFAVAIKPLIDLHGEPKNWAAKIEIYYDVLSDLPEAILAIAVRHQLGSNAYFPKPGELRASVADELQEYRRRREEARLAALPKPEEPPPPSPEDIAYVAEQMQKIRAVLSAHTEVMKGE